MKAKIEWYQEVLELEPGSKVFFPLARLLGEAGQADEAIRVLHQGLARHPEYIEARLLLVHLLQQTGNSEQCADELAEITAIFSGYPGFWEAWSEHSPSDDIACVLSFLSVAFRSPGVSLRDVFAAGLRGLSGQSRPAGAVSGPAQANKRPAAERFEASAVTPSSVSAVQAPVQAPAQATGSVSELATLTAAMRTADTGRSELPAPALPQDEDESHDEPSVRTRTMAEILADQGDVQGAVDIYSEILKSTPPGAEADKLRKRRAELAARLGLADESAAGLAEASSVESAVELDGSDASTDEDEPGPAAPADVPPQAAKLAAVPQDAKLAAVPQDAEFAAVPQDAEFAAVPQAAKLAAVPQDAEFAAVSQDAKLAAVPQDAEFAAVPQDAKLAAVPQDAVSAADLPPAAPSAEAEDSRSANNSMRDMLEKLAQRLDARAQT